MVTGTSLTYVAGDGHRPIPMAGDAPSRRAHAPKPRKPTGLDWDALTPSCKECGEKSGQLDNTDTCPDCRGVQPKPATPVRQHGAYEQTPEEIATRFTAPDNTALGRDLRDLEAEDPVVAAAAAAYDDHVDRVTRPDDHAQAPQTSTPAAPTDTPSTAEHEVDVQRAGVEPPPVYSNEANLAAQLQHVTRVLTDTADHSHPAVRLLRLNAIAAIEALHLFVEMNHAHAAAPATLISPAGAAPHSPEPVSIGLGGERPAAGAEGEAARQPATRRRPVASNIDTDRIVELYTAGKYMREIHETTGHAVSTIKRALLDAGVEIRPRGPKAGARTKTYDPALIADVRRLYVDEQLTQTHVADELGIGIKVVQNVMAYAAIPARDAAHARSQAGIGHPIKIQPDQHQTIIDRYQAGEPATTIAPDYDATATSIYHVLEQHGIERRLNRIAPGVDTLGPLKTAIAATGTTPRAIKDWGLQQGLITTINRGMPHLALVQAYTAAHPTPTGDTAA